MAASQDTVDATPRAARRLESALLFTFVCHGAAMLAMAAILAPMLPGGGVDDGVARVSRIAAHPWLFRLGWLPWQLTALSDVLLAAAFVGTRWIPRREAWAVAALTALAVLPDQGGQLLWVTHGVGLAEAAAAQGLPGPYLAFEAQEMVAVSAWAAALYTAAAVGWTAALSAAGLLTTPLRRLSWPLWTLFALVSLTPLLPEASRPSPALIAAGNALGFVLLEVWTLLALEAVLRRSRPDTPTGRWAPWRYPRRGAVGAVLEAVANSRALRALCERLPVLEFRSEITEVLYVNYLAPAAALAPLLPEGLALQTLGQDRSLALFTFLSYRHGHFGPALLGPLRRLFPSPVQSNWRLYVVDPRSGREGIYFVTNAVSTRLHALGARLMTEGMPMHLYACAKLEVDNARAELRLDPGSGSAPDAEATFLRKAARVLPPPFAGCFPDYEAFLAYVVPQDRALSTQPARQQTTRYELDLGITLASCEPLAGEVRSRAAGAIVGSSTPVSFRVPGVHFRLLGEVHDPWEAR